VSEAADLTLNGVFEVAELLAALAKRLGTAQGQVHAEGVP
jgi:hypothetical protein